MPTSQMNGVIQHLRRILREGVGLTDGKLLEDYVSRRDEAAFAALVRRHGPMVWGVCRRVLRSHHDAEDAFQATFLVLVRKAASITSRELLANWLYGVAHQTALKARATVAKRKGRERQVTEMAEPATIHQDQWRKLQTLLDEELSRLPDKYRTVIVLCDLEGEIRQEAAKHLGLPEGTVASRLSRARAMLAKRLTKHGVTLSGGLLTAALTRQAASAGVPLSVVETTITAAGLQAAGQTAGVVSAKVAALTEGVMKAMAFNKLKSAIAVVLILGFMATGATLLTFRMAAGQDDKKPISEKAVEPPAKQQTADDPKEDAAKEEAEKLHGTWVVVSCEGDGEKVPKEILEKEVVRFTIHADTITIKVDGETTSEERYKLNPKTDPKTIDLTDKEGRNALGIYSLEGDKLRICLTERGKVRPTAFATKSGSGFDLWVLKREKPSKTDQERIQGTWKVVDATSAGEKVPNLDKLNLVFVFKGDKWETQTLDKVESRGSFKLDTDKKPKTIDGRIAGEEGSQMGIYELEGDKLKLCLPDRGNEHRASEFSSTKDNKCSLFILERKK